MHVPKGKIRYRVGACRGSSEAVSWTSSVLVGRGGHTSHIFQFAFCWTVPTYSLVFIYAGSCQYWSLPPLMNILFGRHLIIWYYIDAVSLQVEPF